MVRNRSKGDGLVDFGTLDVFFGIWKGEVVRGRSWPEHKDDPLSLRLNVVGRDPKEVDAEFDLQERQ